MIFEGGRSAAEPQPSITFSERWPPRVGSPTAWMAHAALASRIEPPGLRDRDEVQWDFYSR